MARSGVAASGETRIHPFRSVTMRPNVTRVIPGPVDGTEVANRPSMPSPTAIVERLHRGAARGLRRRTERHEVEVAAVLLGLARACVVQFVPRSQTSTRRRYSAFESTKSVWDPSAITRPSPIMMTRSARSADRSRWAITIAVRPASSTRNAPSISTSVSGSRFDVASSSTITDGSSRNARPRATSCRYPAEKRPPRSRTSVSRPSGRFRTQSSMPIARNTFHTSDSEASGAP